MGCGSWIDWCVTTTRNDRHVVAQDGSESPLTQEVLFYQLAGRSLEDVVRELLQACLSRGWNAVVQAGSRERVAALDAYLWAYDDASFLPHGSERDGQAEHQPVWLTTGEENPNAAHVRFLIDGVHFAQSDHPRTVYVFDGDDETAMEEARDAWRAAREAGHEVTYWQQDAQRRWVRKG